VLVIGVFAALDQLSIAPSITTGLFYALLAIVAGSAIVAIGGGGIVPMRSRVERWLNSVESDMSRAEVSRTAGATRPLEAEPARPEDEALHRPDR
jgi:hypothetical protein